ncbi:MAG TPA: histidine kinase N-terminal 7TM domain-containing protein, partial [Verrucomicrobiae bacterium]|nr:histidine kinase N-terminal 7TM domain-containing protein [Verrucomicrobiae bacterium]
MNPFIVSSIVTSIVSLVMSFVVFANNRNDRVNQIWALTTFLLGMWSMGLAGVVSSKSQDVAMLWQYLLDASAIIIPITFFIFTAHLLNLQEVYKKTVNLSWVAGILLLILSFTKFFKLGVAPKFSFDYWIVPGPLYSIFPLVFCLFVSFSVYLLLKERTRTKNTVLKRQINYVLGAQIFGFGGGITNFFPQLWDIYPVGNYFVLF